MTVIYDDFDRGYAGQQLTGTLLPTGGSWSVEAGSQGVAILDGAGNVNLSGYGSWDTPQLRTSAAGVPLIRTRLEFGATTRLAHVHGVGAAAIGMPSTRNGSPSMRYVNLGVWITPGQLTVTTRKGSVTVSQLAGDYRPERSLEVSFHPSVGAVRVWVDDVLVVNVTLLPSQYPPLEDSGFEEWAGAMFDLVNGYPVLLSRFEASDAVAPEVPNGWQWTTRRVIEQ